MHELELVCKVHVYSILYKKLTSTNEESYNGAVWRGYIL